MTRLAFVVVLFFLAGCGSSSNFVATGSGHNSRVNASLLGQTNIGHSVPDTPVFLNDNSGSLVATTTTGPDGKFQFQGLLPSQGVVGFRLGEGLDFYAQYEASADGSVRFLEINVPTTLAYRLKQQNSSLSLDNSLAQARSLLGIPQHLVLLDLLEVPGTPFSQLSFFKEAEAAGGWVAFSQSLLASVVSQTAPNPVRYPLTVEVLQTPFSALEPELLALLESRRRELLDLGVVPGGEIIKEGAKFVVEGLLDWGLDESASEAWGYVATQVGWNIGTGPKLEAVLGGLESLQDSLNKLIGSLAKDVVQAALNQLSTEITTITQANGFLTALSGTNVDTLITEEPAPITLPRDSAVQALLTDLTTDRDVSGALAAIQNSMLGLNGATNVVLGSGQVQELIQTNQLGIDRPARFGNMPLRSAPLAKRLVQFIEYYQGAEVQALNYLAEAAHASPVTDPNSSLSFATQVNSVVPLSRSVTRRQQQELQQIMPAPMGNVVIDLENGLMWYGVGFTGTWDQAGSDPGPRSVTFSDGTIVTYNDWRLPTYQECLSLQARGYASMEKSDEVKKNSNGPLPDYGQSAAGLPSLGFTGLDTLDENAGIWYQSIKESNGVYQYYKNTEFRLNRENDNHETQEEDTVRTAFLVRSIGEPLLDFRGPDDKTPFYSSTALSLRWSEITPQEYPYLGVPTSLTLSQDGDRVKASVGYTIHLGGDYEYGAVEPKLNRANPEKVYGPVERDRTELVAFSTPGDDTTVDIAVAVGNTQDSVGLLNWRSEVAATLSSTVTGVILGYADTFPSQLNSTVAVSAEVKARTLTDIQIMPQNQNNEISGAQNAQFQLVGFYDDHTIENLTQKATWSVSGGAPSNAQIGNASDPNSDAGLFTVSNFTGPDVPQATTFTIKATVPGFVEERTTLYKTVTN